MSRATTIRITLILAAAGVAGYGAATGHGPPGVAARSPYNQLVELK